jgi:hypothetical protein
VNFRNGFTFGGPARLPYAALGVLRRDPYIDPTEFSDLLVPTDVLVESSAGPVMVALVVGSHLDVLPAHVENCNENAVFVVDRDLGLRSGKAGADEQQPQPCLAGRLRTSVNEVQRDACASDASAARVAIGKDLDVGHLEFRSTSEGIDLRDGGVNGVSTSDIQRGARGSRHAYPVNQLDLVIVDPIGPRTDSNWGMPIVVKNHGWPAGIDPLGAVQRCGRLAPDHSIAP